MATVLYEEFLPYVQPYVPECPIVTIETYLAEAAARFCEKSYIWRVDIEEDSTISGEALYDIDVPTGTILVDIPVLEVDGYAVNRVSDRYMAPSVNEATGVPTYFDIYLDKQIKFYPMPDGAYTFRGTAVVKPSLLSSGVEDFIYETFGREIACGAIAELAAIPGKAWTSLDIAMMHKQKFYKGVNDARVRDLRSVPMRVRAQNF